jgi:hypothetical protein
VSLCSLVGSYQHFGGMNQLHLHFYPEDGGDMFLQNVGNYLQNYMVRTQQTKIHIFIAMKTLNRKWLKNVASL